MERGNCSRLQTHLARSSRELPLDLNTHCGVPRSAEVPRALTFLVCDGAEVSVAGQGGCRLLGNEAAQGRPAPCQAPHGPRLHATPTAGCALQDTHTYITWGPRALHLPSFPPTQTL